MRPRDLLESDCLLHNPLTETKLREACEIGVSKRSFRWTRCSPRDYQMSFGIGRGVAEVQILKKTTTVKLVLSLETFRIF